MIQLPAVFSNHMVLQREKKIEIFGFTDEKELSVTLVNDKLEVKGNVFYLEEKDGRNFKAILPKLEAGGPYTLKVKSPCDEITFSDVMIGEVWLAGGQSNMEFELQNCSTGLEELKSGCKDVRFYYTPKVTYIGDELFHQEKNSSWQTFSKDTAYNWSAVGYYFAKELSEKLHVTVGIIGCNWGGTSASCWMSREALESKSVLSSYLEDYDKATENQVLEEYIKEYEDYLIYQAEFDKNVSHYYATNENPTWDEAISLFGENKYPGPMGPRSFTRPYGLYESMLKRVMPYTLKGFIFYQGEEDDNKPYLYETLLSTLISQWRKDWNDESLPFLNVMLPVFRDEQETKENMSWPFIREAEMNVYKKMRHTGLSVIMDLGEDKNVHPKDKKTVGERLSLQAFSEVYGILSRDESCGPMLNDFEYDENGKKMILSFDYVNDGFMIKDEVHEFEIAGIDGIYKEAKVTFDGNKVILSSDEVEKPMYARYLWKNFSKVNVFNSLGLPMAPFRTDKFDKAISLGNRQEKEVYPYDIRTEY